MIDYLLYNINIRGSVPKSHNCRLPDGGTEYTMAKRPGDETITFSLHDNAEDTMHETLKTVYNALVEKGYNPINQIVGYILSEDPTYITNHNNARALIRKLDRDELLTALLKCYLNIK